MTATIERRLLVNYRVDPDVVARLLPEPFRPKLVGGAALAGICLIRLGRLRPAGAVGVPGFTSENAAHRIAVEWDGAEGPLAGVYIPRRDTSSRLTALAGGRLFPGEHQLARFDVHEDEDRYRIAVDAVDASTRIRVTRASPPSCRQGRCSGRWRALRASSSGAPSLVGHLEGGRLRRRRAAHAGLDDAASPAGRGRVQLLRRSRALPTRDRRA